MKKTIMMLLALAGLASLAQASACPEANYDGCASDGYSIVEAEPMTYWPHNEMASAHELDNKPVRYKRVRVRRRGLFSCAH